MTMAEVRRLNPGRRVRWQAGHVDAGNPNSELLAEDSLCNERDGQRRTQASKAAKVMPHSKRWADLVAMFDVPPLAVWQIRILGSLDV